MNNAHPAQPPDFIKLLANDVRWGLLKALAMSDHQVNELVALLGQPMNLVSYHLKKLREDSLVSTRRSDADGRDIYYSLDFDRLRQLYLQAGDALHPTLTLGSQNLGEKPFPYRRVLFICTHNSARSQMAEGLLRHLSSGQLAAFSAGSNPTTVHPDAVRTMARFGIDISQQRSRSLAEFAAQPFDYIITVCDKAREVCPTFAGEGQQIHWSFPDPAAVSDRDERERAFENIARHLQARIHLFLAAL